LDRDDESNLRDESDRPELCSINPFFANMRSDASLPDFYLLGAAKCGTTSLWLYIQQHPDLYRFGKKEPHVLNAPEREFESQIEGYRDLYASSASKLAGDGTPSYFRDADVVIPRMKSLYKSKSPMFILIFRDPVERAFSHYLHKRRAGVVPDTFEAALEYEKEHPERSQKRWKTFYQDGLYAPRLRNWMDHFPEDQFLFLILDDLKTNAGKTVRRIFRFLGVDPSVEVNTSKQYRQRRNFRSRLIRNLLREPSNILHSAVTTILPKPVRRYIRRMLQQCNQTNFDDPPEMSPDTAEFLRHEYSDSIRELEDLINRDLSHWRSFQR
jgi:hypothetical protein